MSATTLLYKPSRCKKSVARAFNIDQTTCVPRWPIVKIGERSWNGPANVAAPSKCVSDACSSAATNSMVLAMESARASKRLFPSHTSQEVGVMSH